MLRVNLIGTFNCIRLAATAMLNNAANDSGERGVIINSASVAAFEGQIGQAAYSASKGRHSRHDPANRPRSGSLWHSRLHDCAGHLRYDPCWAACQKPCERPWARRRPSRNAWGTPAEYAQLAQQIVENEMLNGETIRLDGALRMQPN